MEHWTVEESLASSVLSSSPLATIVLDQERCIRGFNPAAERVTGRPAASVVGEHVSLLFLRDEVTASLALLEEAATGDAGHIELELRGGDGGVVPIGVSWAPLVHDGRTIGLVGVGRDIARRKALEHERATMANSFRGLAEGSGLGMYRFAFGPQLRVDYVNPHFEAIFGVSLAELTVDPTPLWERLDSHAREQLDGARRGEDVLWPIDARWHHPSGRTLDCQLHEVQLRTVSGRLEWVLGVVRDVTGQRRQQRALASALDLERAAADRLRRVDELRQIFLQAVSHELRTPLTAILGFGATLRDRGHALLPDGVSELADRIHRQGERMQRLLDDLLDVDRLSRGALHLERAPTDLAALIRRVNEDRDDDAVEVVTPPCTADVDAAKIERIVDNLLSNARRHAGAAARVRVTIEPGDPVKIVVEDDGPGVPEPLRATVFEPFEQGTTAEGSPSPGTGIGLTLVSAFAELHGGQASVDVSELGGARFVVELPVSGVAPVLTAGERGQDVAGWRRVHPSSAVTQPRRDTRARSDDVTTSTSKAHWNGDLKTGSGQLTVGPDRWEAPFNAPSRFEGAGETTTPEELLAAAHAGCYSMALSNMLAGEGHTPDEVRTVADVVIGRVDGKPAISTITLKTAGKVPGIDEATFTEFAQKAKDGCPVSKLFAGGTAEINLEVSFES